MFGVVHTVFYGYKFVVVFSPCTPQESLVFIGTQPTLIEKKAPGGT